MSVVPPSAPVAPSKPFQLFEKAIMPVGLQRVYVAGDGRHPWSLNRALTLCGMVTSPADVTKPGDVECSQCKQLTEVHHDDH